jgi:hypothetical protein
MTVAENLPTRGRAPRRDKGQPLWTPRDLAMLVWMADQYAVRRDHLAVLLGQRAEAQTKVPGQLADTTVKDWVHRWRRVGIIESRRVLLEAPGWVWVTREGLEHLEVAYRYWEPKERGLAHLHAINQVRLLVEQRQPAAIWRSERWLHSEQPVARQQSDLTHRPDAEVLLGPQTVAIEVERSAKAPQRLPAICYELARRYDGIWYFCPKPVLESMQRAVAQLDPAVRRKFSLVELP